MAPNNIHTLSSKKKGSTAASAKKTGIYFGATNKAGNRVTQKLKPITNQQPKKGMQTLADMAADTHVSMQIVAHDEAQEEASRPPEISFLARKSGAVLEIVDHDEKTKKKMSRLTDSMLGRSSRAQQPGRRLEAARPDPSTSRRR